jgi:hypothetical protein
MKKYLKMLSLLAVITGLSSCLKDEPIIANKPENIVEFYTTEAISSPPTALYPVYVKSYVVGVPAKINVVVSYSGTDTAPQDITLDVAVDPTALTKYNTKAAADGNQEYEQLPTSAYTFPTAPVVIKKGERRATITVDVVIPADFDFDKSFALPLTIKSTTFGTISGNFGSTLYAIGAKNKYDGEYTVDGTMVDNTSSALTGRYPINYYLITQTSTSNVLFDYVYAHTYGHEITSGGGPSYYGSFSPVFTFDADGNITNVVNYYGQPASNGRSAQLDPSGVNKFISGTPGEVGSKFQVKYFMLQPGSTIRSVFDETFTYVGPTP